MGREYVTPRISMPERLLKKIDKEADLLSMNRSEFFRFLFFWYLSNSGNLEDVKQIKKRGKKNCRPNQ